MSITLTGASTTFPTTTSSTNPYPDTGGVIYYRWDTGSVGTSSGWIKAHTNLGTTLATGNYTTNAGNGTTLLAGNLAFTAPATYQVSLAGLVANATLNVIVGIPIGNTFTFTGVTVKTP